MFSSLFDSQFTVLIKYKESLSESLSNKMRTLIKESLDENINLRYPSDENMNLLLTQLYDHQIFCLQLNTTCIHFIKWLHTHTT